MEKTDNSSKQEIRWEKKKRKIKAFLTLCGNDEDASNSKKNKLSDSVEDEEMAKGNISINKSDEVNCSQNSMKNMSDEERKQLKALLKERKKALMQQPKFFFTLDKLQPVNRQHAHTVLQLNKVEEEKELTVFTSDLQALLLYACIGNEASYKPRWCKLLRVEALKQLVMVVLDDISTFDYHNQPASFPFLHEKFDMSVEMVPASYYGKTLAQELFNVLLSNRKTIKLKRAARHDEVTDHNAIARRHVKADPRLLKRSSAVIDSGCSRKRLLLNHDQMLQDNFPSPTGSELYSKYIYTQDVYKKVRRCSPIFALDCEMCMSIENRLVLTRIAIVNEQLETVYHTLVKPSLPIKDYLTRFSGITKKLLFGVNKTLEDVQQDLRSILPADAILCGHSLNGDLHALQMFHPYIIDTSVIYCLSGDRKRKPALRTLTSLFLSRNIQEKSSGHDPIEDAKATMELLKLKLANGIAFGDVTMGPISASIIDQSTMAPKSKNVMDNDDEDANEVNGNAKEASNDANDTVSDANEANDADGSSDEDVTSQSHYQQQAFSVCSQQGFFESFWHLLSQHGRSATLCDQKDIVQGHLPYGITFHKCATNEETINTASNAISENQFYVWCHLQKEKELTTLDSHLHRLITSLSANVLVVIVLNGQLISPKQCRNALILAKLV